MWILYFVGPTIKYISLKETSIIDLISQKERWMMGTRAMCQKAGKECYTVHRETLIYRRKKLYSFVIVKEDFRLIEKIFQFVQEIVTIISYQLVTKFL